MSTTPAPEEQDLPPPLDPPQITSMPTETEGTPVVVLDSRILTTPAGLSQLSKCSLEGTVFYVRENVADGKKFLELCAPEFYWLRISGIVKCEDSLERPVIKNEEFTVEWAERMLHDVLAN